MNTTTKSKKVAAKKINVTKLIKGKSLKNLKADVVYETKNYSLFKHSKYNRAMDEGYMERKVKMFITLIIAGKFYHLLSEIKVNRNGIIWEGNHRFEALKRLGLPVRFMIYDAEEVNGTSEDMLKVQITFNGVRSNWNRNAIIKTGIKVGGALVVAVDQMLNDLYNDEKYSFLNKRNFTHSKVIGILMKDIKMLHGRNITLEILESVELAEKLTQDEFIKEFEFVVALMNLLYSDKFKNISNEPREIVKAVLDAVWSGLVTKEKIYHMIAKNGFNCEKGNRNIKALVSSYANTYIANPKKMIKW